jgi:hypothetical protein
MTRWRGFWAKALDPGVALLLGCSYLALLLATVRELGYARDEGFYFAAAKSYEGWFELLFSNPSQAFQRASVDRFWNANHEHPALMKSLFALSHRFLHEKWRLIAEEGTAYRFPAMALSALSVSVTYLWGRRAIGRTAGLVAALLFALMPHTFHHAHLACFDMPVAAMWLLTTYAYSRSLGARGLGWALVTGLLYGLLLNTKHNSWLLPPALVVHFIVTRGPRLGRELKLGRIALPAGLVAMAVIGPLVFYATWPWIWFDTGKRLAGYVAFHTGHDYYNMEFLGETYWKPPMPRLYAWLMTLGTVPGITLLLFSIGLAVSALRAYRGRIGAWIGRLSRSRRADTSTAAASASATSSVVDPSDRSATNDPLLWLLSILTSYAPWLSSTTPIFGGTKHWLTAYAFIGLFAGLGFDRVLRELKDFFGQRVGPSALIVRGLGPLAVAATAAAPLVMTLHSYPWGLSAYTPLVGGASGAATLGLNRTFWGYTTGAVQDFLNQRVPRGGSVFVHDTAVQSFDMMRLDERIRRDIRGAWSIHDSMFALYHHEPHMGRVEYQIWIDYGTSTPVEIGVFDGVPVVWVYERPPANRFAPVR